MKTKLTYSGNGKDFTDILFADYFKHGWCLARLECFTTVGREDEINYTTDLSYVTRGNQIVYVYGFINESHNFLKINGYEFPFMNATPFAKYATVTFFNSGVGLLRPNKTFFTFKGNSFESAYFLNNYVIVKRDGYHVVYDGKEILLENEIEDVMIQRDTANSKITYITLYSGDKKAILTENGIINHNGYLIFDTVFGEILSKRFYCGIGEDKYIVSNNFIIKIPKQFVNKKATHRIISLIDMLTVNGCRMYMYKKMVNTK